eukprot:UN18686
MGRYLNFKNDIENEGFTLNLSIYATILSCLGPSKNIDIIENFIQETESKFDTKNNVVFAGAAANCYAAVGDVEKVASILNKYQQSTVIFGVLIKTLYVCDKMNELPKWFDMYPELRNTDT